MSNKTKIPLYVVPEPETYGDVTTDRDFKGPTEQIPMKLGGLNATLPGVVCLIVG